VRELLQAHATLLQDNFGLLQGSLYALPRLAVRPTVANQRQTCARPREAVGTRCIASFARGQLQTGRTWVRLGRNVSRLGFGRFPRSGISTTNDLRALPPVFTSTLNFFPFNLALQNGIDRCWVHVLLAEQRAYVPHHVIHTLPGIRKLRLRLGNPRRLCLCRRAAPHIASAYPSREFS